MTHLPVIIGMGGINPAGRTSGQQALKRMLLPVLSTEQQQDSLLSLASVMGLARRTGDDTWQTGEGVLSGAAVVARYRQTLLDNSLIRRIHPDWLDVQTLPRNLNAILRPTSEPLQFELHRRHLPQRLPPGWQVQMLSVDRVQVTLSQPLEALIPDPVEAPVQAAGMLPTGFNPASLYRSAHHPRALQMAVFGASDLLGQTGIAWENLAACVSPDQIGVFASNSIGQMDQEGWGGLLQSQLAGKRATSKQMPMGYAQMTADFINAYLLGNVGQSAGLLGACATFLYSLQIATEAIREGRLRVALVGTSDAPIVPEIIEGFRAMGALADDASLRMLDGITALTDEHYRRACRPFAENCGFTLGEAAQFVLLVDDALAVELGAQVLGAVPQVFSNADGFKRSISAPGVGNYLTLAKAAALGRSLLGEQALRTRSYVHAHATSTPKNRVTESHVLNEVARAMGILAWPVAAIKAFVGHSQGSAAGDQLTAALGSWALGWVPGITTVERFAGDVHDSHLYLTNQHWSLVDRPCDLAFINAKGFGGNNASALVLSPEVTLQMLHKRHGTQAMKQHAARLETTCAASAAYEAQAAGGDFQPVYRFGERVLEGSDLHISADAIRLPGYAHPVSLQLANPFADMV